MERRFRMSKRQLRKWEKIDKIFTEKTEEVKKLERQQLEKDWMINSLRLAAEAEREIVFGENVKILDICPGCNYCKNEKECYIVEMDK